MKGNTAGTFPSSSSSLRGEENQWRLNAEGKRVLRVKTPLLEAVVVEREDKRYKSTLGVDEVLYHTAIRPSGAKTGKLTLVPTSFLIASVEKLIYKVSLVQSRFERSSESKYEKLREK